jgi:hypothetical protein
MARSPTVTWRAGGVSGFTHVSPRLSAGTLARDILALPDPARKRMIRLAIALVAAPEEIRDRAIACIGALASTDPGLDAVLEQVDGIIERLERSRCDPGGRD